MIKNKTKFLLSNNLYTGENFEPGQKFYLFQTAEERLRALRAAQPEPTPAPTSEPTQTTNNSNGKNGVVETFIERVTDPEKKEYYRNRLYNGYTAASRTLWEGLGRVPDEVITKLNDDWAKEKTAGGQAASGEAAKTDAETRAAETRSKTDPTGTLKQQADRKLQNEEDQTTVTRQNALTDKEKAIATAQIGYNQTIDSKKWESYNETFKVESQDIIEDRKTQNAIRDANLQKANDPLQERPKEQMFRLINQDLTPSGLMPERAKSGIKPDGSVAIIHAVQYGSVDFTPYMFERESTTMQYFKEFTYYYVPKDTYKLKEFQGGQRLLNVDLGELSNKDSDVTVSSVPAGNNPLEEMSKVNKPRRVFAKRNDQNKETIEYFYYLDEAGAEHKLSPEQRLDVYCKGDLLTHPKLGDIENSTESLENYLVHADEANKLWFHGSLPKQAQEKFDMLSCIIEDPFVRRSLADLLGGLGQKSFLEIIVAIVMFFVNQSKGCLDEKIDTKKLIEDINKNPQSFSNMLTELEGNPTAKAAFEALLSDPELMKDRKLNSVDFLELKAAFYSGYLSQTVAGGVAPAIAITQADEMFNKVLSKFSPDTDALKAFNQYIVSDGKLSQDEARNLQSNLADEGITGADFVQSLSKALQAINPASATATTPNYNTILNNMANLDGILQTQIDKKPSKDKPVQDVDFNRYRIMDIKTSVENVISH